LSHEPSLGPALARFFEAEGIDGDSLLECHHWVTADFEQQGLGMGTGLGTWPGWPEHLQLIRDIVRCWLEWDAAHKLAEIEQQAQDRVMATVEAEAEAAVADTLAGAADIAGVGVEGGKSGVGVEGGKSADQTADAVARRRELEEEMAEQMNAERIRLFASVPPARWEEVGLGGGHDSVRKWLDDAGFGGCAAAFKQERVEGEALFAMYQMLRGAGGGGGAGGAGSGDGGHHLGQSLDLTSLECGVWSRLALNALGQKARFIAEVTKLFGAGGAPR
jgi:hypothetical protein